MKRRDFLKFIGVASIAPSVLAGRRNITPKPEWPLGTKKLKYNGCDSNGIEQYSTLVYVQASNNPIGIALEDIAKDGYGWFYIKGGHAYPIFEEGEPK